MIVLAGGPGIFLLGHMLFKYAVWGVISPHRVAAIGALLGLILIGTLLPPVAVALIATGITIGVVAIDAGVLGSIPRSEHEQPEAVPVE